MPTAPTRLNGLAPSGTAKRCRISVANNIQAVNRQTPAAAGASVGRAPNRAVQCGAARRVGAGIGR